jgi:hypothetical protein
MSSFFKHGLNNTKHVKGKKGKAVPVTGREGPILNM